MKYHVTEVSRDKIKRKYEVDATDEDDARVQVYEGAEHYDFEIVDYDPNPKTTCELIQPTAEQNPIGKEGLVAVLEEIRVWLMAPALDDDTIQAFRDLCNDTINKSKGGK